MSQNSLYISKLIISGVFFMSFILSATTVSAQGKCASHLILQERIRKSKVLSDQNFEEWLSKKMTQRKLSQQIKGSASRTAAIVQIPVVFHIIHKGETIGQGVNLPKERLDRQLETLNEDFNLLNGNLSETIDEFQDLSADVEIEFVYARQDPSGFETNGIVRLIGSQFTYSYDQRATLSAESYWPPEDYLNIWITDVASPSLGWAEFPIANLPGLEEASGNRLIDGVTIDYQYIGDNPNSPVFESKGRTLTHEMGHFFGLRHIWGDGGCSIDDFCEDTPEASSSHTGCNLETTSCNSLSMVQNFMDYTNDACMTLFTHDQKSRMRAVVENSPRRLSLTTSVALEEPIPLNKDLALQAVNQKFISNCDQLYTPTTLVRNQGLDSISNYTVELKLRGSITERKTFPDTIPPGQEVKVDFDPISFSSFGDYELTYKLILNGQTDERISNNELQEFYQQNSSKSVPYQKDFSTGFSDWLVQNLDDEESWEDLNGYAGIPLYQKRTNLGQKDRLISPIFDLTALDIPALELVYSQAADTNAHQLSIYASYDCGASFTDLLYSSNGNEVVTAYGKNEAFIPEYRLDWDSLYLDLGRLRGKPSVCFRIEVENRGNNNFYLSQFKVEESKIPEKRLSPVNWKTANALYCEEPIQSMLTLKNTGRSAVTNFNIVIKNGEEVLNELSENVAIVSDQVVTYKLPSIEALSSSGTLELEVSTSFENELITESIFLPFEKSCSEEIPPIRLDLSKASKENWYIFNPDRQESWIFDNQYNAMSSQSAFVSKELEEDWLISPIVDVTRTEFLSLIFKVAYHKPYKQQEALEVYLLNETNGDIIETLIYDKSADSLATSFGNELDADPIFRSELIDLSPYTYKEKIRVAIKAMHGNGANIYLKDVTFFIGQETPPAYPNSREQFVIYPNPVIDGTLNLHFNLNQADAGSFKILDLRGNVIMLFYEPKILNQFVSFNVSDLASGLYLLNFQTDGLNQSVRFIVE